MSELDVRIAAFAWLREHGAANGDIFPGTLLNQGFVYQGRRITLKGAAGIWFPQGFAVPISITTALDGPYHLDDIADDGLLTYAYRGQDPRHRDNQGLRYAWAQTRQRLHQGAFRDIVITAYCQRCTICRLAHAELLDAAHITPDSDDRGTPVVQNGLSLCKIHHAAYDTDILGISPDYRVHISRRVLEETDGPMLRHGLQELDGARIVLPSRPIDHPDRDRLARRFETWRHAS